MEESFCQFVSSGGTDDTLNKLLELAKDPMYDPSNDPDFDPLEGSLNYEELPFYTEDPYHHDVKFNELTPLRSISSRLSRKKRNDHEGNYRFFVFRRKLLFVQ